MLTENIPRREAKKGFIINAVRKGGFLNASRTRTGDANYLKKRGKVKK